MRYQTKSSGSFRGKTTFFAGKFENSEPEAGSTDLIRHVYLPPLRDAQYALGSGSATRITALLKYFLNENEEEEKDFLNRVSRPSTEPDKVINSINTEICGALGDLSSGVRSQTAALGFTSETLFDVARDLRFKMADAGLTPDEIRFSGLGYANLLYIATVVIELSKAKEADLTLFLVEEPEAHLHPQLQMLVLEFLLDKAQKSSEQILIAGQPEGRIQVIVTTHSPNLTAWVSPEHLVVIKSQKSKDCPSELPETVCIPIAELGLAPKEINKISRYLDVTRSALLFGNRALLIEGIAEALLLPVIARYYVLKNDHAALLRFQGTVITPIGGVDFKPYVEMLLKPTEGARIVDRLVVITDEDPTVPGDRKKNLEALASQCGASNNLIVFSNQQTLEYELFQAGNEALLKKSFLSIHIRSTQDWETKIEGIKESDRPAAFIKLIKDKQTRKGDFAQHISSFIENGETFIVPKYLEDAIKSVSKI